MHLITTIEAAIGSWWSKNALPTAAGLAQKFGDRLLIKFNLASISLSNSMLHPNLQVAHS